ncbi:MAG TPA: translation initiation factor IF-2 associated domain-containing protein, partial [Aestuariivirgaceae bacterium]|nr:translation initiation factor IF-2 associated domain-containing protein [Aestuariivirgaceae bacterium]
MSDTKDTSKHGTGGRTLSVKRPAVEQGRVRQNFSHGRSKTVAVEIKRKRAPGSVESAKIESRETQPLTLKPAAPRAEPKRDEPLPSPSVRPGMVLRTLTDDEKEARERALADARVREAEERKRVQDEAKRRSQHDEVERREREAAEARKVEEEARRKTEAEAKRRGEETARKLEPRVAVEAEADEEDVKSRSKVKREVKLAPARTKTDMERRRGKLTISNALDDSEEKSRSLAAFRRRTERQKKQAQGFQMPTEKPAREVTIPEVITIQELANRMAERAVDVIKLLMKQGDMHTINDV